MRRYCYESVVLDRSCNAAPFATNSGAMPGVSYFAAGAVSGFIVQVYANSLRRLPALRRPWEHMILMGVGAYGMDALGKYTIKAQEQYDENQQKVRTAHTMRYN